MRAVRISFALFFVSLFACGSSSSGGATDDAGTDGSIGVDSSSSDGVGGDAPVDTLRPESSDVTSAHGDFHKLVLDAVTLPTSHGDHAYDLNGDGKPDNQYGNLVAALTTQGFDLQKAMDDAIKSGSALELASVQTADATMQTDATVGCTLQPATSTPTPDFSGKGSFTADASFAPGTLFGALVAGAFRSNEPSTTTHPVTIFVRLPVFGGVDLVPVPLNGAHATFTASPSALKGEIHGSLKRTDVDTIVVPAIATRLTAIVKADPASSNAKQIETLFDVGGCANPDGTTAKSGDMTIDPCEVSSNTVIQTIFAPDVQIFSDDGSTYAPNPANTHKDSISVGFAFTAVVATF